MSDPVASQKAREVEQSHLFPSSIHQAYTTGKWRREGGSSSLAHPGVGQIGRSPLGNHIRAIQW